MWFQQAGSVPGFGDVLLHLTNAQSSNTATSPYRQWHTIFNLATAGHNGHCKRSKLNDTFPRIELQTMQVISSILSIGCWN